MKEEEPKKNRKIKQMIQVIIYMCVNEKYNNADNTILQPSHHATCPLASRFTYFAQRSTLPLLHNLPINDTRPTPGYDCLLTLDSSSQ